MRSSDDERRGRTPVCELLTEAGANLEHPRQFSFYEDDEHDHMAQSHRTFRYEPTDALGERNLWSLDIGSSDV